jgi:hypothetical protein
MRKMFALCILAVSGMFVISGQVMAASTINLNSNEWLGQLKLDAKQLKAIKSAVEKALNAPIDAEQQCGKVRLDCVVRAAREWEYDGSKFREIVINIHTVGHASRAVEQKNGKWPAVAAK